MAAKNFARDAAIVDAFNAGRTMTELARLHQISVARICQILGARGLRTHPAPNYERSHGISREVARTLPVEVRAFSEQKRKAISAGYAWSLTFAEWLGVWRSSGQFARRGLSKHSYCLARKDPSLGFVSGNVAVMRLCDVLANRIPGSSTNRARVVHGAILPNGAAQQIPNLCANSGQVANVRGVS